MQVKIYRTYRFLDKDPAIDAMRTIMKDEGLKPRDAAMISGLAVGTLGGWFEKDTKNPRNSSITAFTSSLGYVRRDHLDKDGQVRVGYVHARKLNYEAEKEKALRFEEKQNSSRPKRRKKKKANGNGHA